MSDRRWLITGISGGLGRALAEAALARGDRVAGTSRDGLAAAAFGELAPGRSHGLVADLRDCASIPALVDDGVARLGGLDILVNNAGYALAGAIEEVSLDEARAQFEINLFAPLAMAQAALPHLRRGSGGRIINIASMAALQGFRGLGLYCASKSALASLSEVLAIEGAGFFVRTISVEATGFRTRFAGASLAVAERRLDPYRDMREEMSTAFRRSDGNQPNDPAKGALALIALAELADPPAHFALGDQAIERIEALFGRRIEEYRRFGPMGASTV